MGPLMEWGEIGAISRYCLIVLLWLGIKKKHDYTTLTCSISMCVGTGTLPIPAFWNYTFSHQIFHKKIVSQAYSGSNEISPLLAPLQKSFWLPLESTIDPSLEKILPLSMSIGCVTFLVLWKWFGHWCQTWILPSDLVFHCLSGLFFWRWVF